MSKRPVASVALPASMCREIGRVIIRIAYIEHYLQGIIYMLVGVDRGIDKLAVREPRGRDRIGLIQDLIAARALKPAPIDLDQLAEALDDAEDIRNLCAHGAWTWSEPHTAWAVLVDRGKWDGVDKKQRALKNKRLFPEGQIVRQSTLATYVTGLDGIATKLRTLQADLELQLSSSPQTRISPSFDRAEAGRRLRQK